jgi:hypothetical protein
MHGSTDAFNHAHAGVFDIETDKTVDYSKSMMWDALWRELGAANLGYITSARGTNQAAVFNSL